MKNKTREFRTFRWSLVWEAEGNFAAEPVGSRVASELERLRDRSGAGFGALEWHSDGTRSDSGSRNATRR